jgi:hypothetical protein
LSQAKYKFREYLYESAWGQTKNLREMAWDDKELMSQLEINEPDYAFHLIKHIINISLGNSFLLKPVSFNDGVLYDVFKNLVEKFKFYSDRRGNLLDYSTPIFLHYTKLNKENPRGIELTHSPSINMFLPGTRLDTMKHNIMYQIFFKNRVQEYLKNKGFEIKLKYFKEKSNNSTNSPWYVTGLNEYIETELTSLYSLILPKNMNVKLPKSPSLFNSFIQIERTKF